MASDRGTASAFRADELDPAWLEGCDHLFVSGYALLREPARSAAHRAAVIAREQGSAISIDLTTWSAIGDAGPVELRETATQLAPDAVFATEREEEIFGGPLPDSSGSRSGEREGAPSTATSAPPSRSRRWSTRPERETRSQPGGSSVARISRSRRPPAACSRSARCPIRLGGSERAHRRRRPGARGARRRRCGRRARDHAGRARVPGTGRGRGRSRERGGRTRGRSGAGDDRRARWCHPSGSRAIRARALHRGSSKAGPGTWRPARFRASSARRRWAERSPSPTGSGFRFSAPAGSAESTAGSHPLPTSPRTSPRLRAPELLSSPRA